MKINSKNIIIPALMLMVGTALVGSVTGTVAWYQYSTRTTAAYVGTSASVGRKLQIKVGSGQYTTDLTNKDIASYLATSASANDHLVPCTTGAKAKDAALGDFFGSPVRQFEDMADWAAAKAEDRVYLPLTLKLQNNNDQPIVGEKIYLSHLQMLDSVPEGKESALGALRVHFSTGTYNYTFAHGADADDIEVVTHGQLDLDNDGHDDLRPTEDIGIYDEDNYNPDPCDYGSVYNGNAIAAATNKQVAYSDQGDYFANDSKAKLTNLDKALPFGVTNNNGELTINVTIWLEGWAELGESGSESSIWNRNTIGTSFKVGMRFVVDTRDVE